MPTLTETRLWSTTCCEEWPNAPAWMSFSTLSELETCPRRWALNHAEYPKIWDGRGYPQPLHIGSLEGSVVHVGLRRIIGALAENGCRSLSDEAAISTMRELGGFTQVVSDSLDYVLKTFEANPRAAWFLEEMRHSLVARIPSIRTKVQKLLARVHLHDQDLVNRSKVIRRARGKSRRYLSYGSYSEVEIRSDELMWRGFADLVTLSSSSCEIRDFKTGEPNVEHEFQLRVYATLWTLDSELNPTGRLASRLVLSYGTEDLEISAPSVEEILLTKEELRLRSKKALSHLGCSPPQADVSQENCGYCPVRQMCDDYWPWISETQPTIQHAIDEFRDVQVTLVSRHGPRSWDARVGIEGDSESGEPILLRFAAVPFELQPGQRVRLLNVFLSVSDENLAGGSGQLVATMSKTSEVFLVV